MKKSMIISGILIILMVAGYSISSNANTGNGSIEFKKIIIPTERGTLSGFLYTPKVNSTNPIPAVLLTHGISNSKETLTGIAIELSSRGMVCLCLDLYGHGLSEGQLGNNDPSIGVISGVEYLGSLDYVDESRLALIGHSLGAGAVRAASDQSGIWANVFIGGGMNAGNRDITGILNSTLPRNLLLAVGSNDILFDIESFKTDIAPVFGVESPIEPGKVYGDKIQGTGRKLTISSTIHLLEPVDGIIVNSVTEWVFTSLKSEDTFDEDSPLYSQRDNGNLFTVIAFTLLVYPLSDMAWNSHRVKTQRGSTKNDQLLMLFWSVLGLILFIPAMALGAIVPFPPQVFGSSLAWWLLVTGIIGLLVLKMKKRVKSISEIIEKFQMREVFLEFALFSILYLIVYGFENYYGIGLMYVIPFFRSLSLQRMPMVPAYLPFFLTYFTAEGFYLHSNTRTYTDNIDLLKPSIIKTSPYILLLTLQYGGMYLLNVRLIPGIIGFFLEFLWGIVPIFLITTLWSAWLRKTTGNIVAGVVLNTLVVSWIAATTFPFGVF